MPPGVIPTVTLAADRLPHNVFMDIGNGGYFAARPEEVGCEWVEVIAMAAGVLSEQRRLDVVHACARAAAMLRHAPPAGIA